MEEPKIYLITGNEDIRNRNLFLENLTYHKKLKGENPLIINFVLGNQCFKDVGSDKEKKTAQNNNKKNKYLQYHTDIDIPVIDYTALSFLCKKNKGEELFLSENDYDNIFIFGEPPQEMVPIFDCIDHITLLIKNDYETSSYLYNFINKLYERMIVKNISIIISDIKRIEDAGDLFIKLHSEMKEMIDQSLSFEFLGHFPLDIRKISFTRRINKIYIKLFFEDEFHGCLKYIDEKMHGQEYFKIKPLFKTLTELLDN